MDGASEQMRTPLTFSGRRSPSGLTHSSEHSGEISPLQPPILRQGQESPVPTGSALLSSESGPGLSPSPGPGVGGPWGQHLCSEPGGRGGEGSRPWWRHPESAPRGLGWAGCLPGLSYPLAGERAAGGANQPEPRGSAWGALWFQRRAQSPRTQRGRGGPCRPRLGPGDPPPPAVP